MFIGPVERLPEDELPSISTIANIEPVADAAPCGGGSLMYLCAGGAAVHATDDQVEIVLQIVPSGQMLRTACQSSPQNRFRRLIRATDLNSPISLAENGWRTQFAAEIRSPSITVTARPDGWPPAINAW